MAAFLRLIRIEVLRGGGWLVLAIALLSVYVTDLRFLIWDDSRRSGNAPTWYTITAVGYAITGLFRSLPLTELGLAVGPVAAELWSLRESNAASASAAHRRASSRWRSGPSWRLC
ncbi:MAG: hypothetical protein ACR2OE_19090 [Thermomicrobiales bacterium]